MSKIRYLNLMQDDEIKKIAKKFCFEGNVGFEGFNRNIDSYKIDKNDNNVVVYFKNPRCKNRLSVVIMNDYYIASMNEFSFCDIKDFNNPKYNDLMQNIFGENYKNDLNNYKNQLNKYLLIKNYTSNLTDDDLKEFISQIAEKSHYKLLPNSVKILRKDNKTIVDFTQKGGVSYLNVDNLNNDLIKNAFEEYAKANNIQYMSQSLKVINLENEKKYAFDYKTIDGENKKVKFDDNNLISLLLNYSPYKDKQLILETIQIDHLHGMIEYRNFENSTENKRYVLSDDGLEEYQRYKKEFEELSSKDDEYLWLGFLANKFGNEYINDHQKYCDYLYQTNKNALDIAYQINKNFVENKFKGEDLQTELESLNNDYKWKLFTCYFDCYTKTHCYNKDFNNNDEFTNIAKMQFEKEFESINTKNNVQEKQQ